MRLIDADNLYVVLDNIVAQLLETEAEPQRRMAYAIRYAMGTMMDQPTITPPPSNPLTLASREGADMDYKELIETYRSYASRWESGEQLLLGGGMRIQDTLREAADAIETLLAERDAAVEDLRGDCKTCTYFDKLNLHEKCVHCKYARGLLKPKAAVVYNWQWRGPQKEGSSDGQA